MNKSPKVIKALLFYLPAIIGFAYFIQSKYSIETKIIGSVIIVMLYVISIILIQKGELLKIFTKLSISRIKIISKEMNSATEKRYSFLFVISGFTSKTHFLGELISDNDNLSLSEIADAIESLDKKEFFLYKNESETINILSGSRTFNLSTGCFSYNEFEKIDFSIYGTVDSW